MKYIYLSLIAFWCLSINAQVLNEGFEGQTFPPDGWTTYETGQGANQSWDVSVVSNSGEQSAKITYENTVGGNAEDWLVTSQLAINDADDAILTFYTRQSLIDDYGSIYSVRVSTTSQDTPTDFTVVQEWDETTLNATYDAFEQKSIDLSAYIGDNIYVAFVMVNDDGDSWYVDDVVVGTASCPEPDTFTATPSGDSVVLDWTETGTIWDVVLIEEGSDFPTEPTYNNLTDNTLTINGLNSGMNYQAYVRVDCAGDNTDVSIWKTVTFVSDCSAYDAPYTEDFTTFLPTCWQEAKNGSITTGPDSYENGSWTSDTFANITDGSGAAKINLYSVNRQEWLISPEINLNENLNYQVQFDLAVQQYTQSDIPGVFGSDDNFYVLITNDGGSSWNQLLHYDANNTFVNGGTTVASLLSDYSGTIQIAFYGSDGIVDDSEDFEIFIDNFQVLEQLECDAPTNISVSSDIGGSSVTWDDSDAQSWDIAVVLTGEALDTSTPITSVDINSYAFENLENDTTYDVYVRADCFNNDVNFSEWAGPVQFTTPVSTVPLGNTCENPIMVNTLPYTTTDDTANYEDDYDGGQGTNCGNNSQFYLGGDDVVYSFTSTTDTSIDISLNPTATWSGIFIYDSCEDIGVTCTTGAAAGDAEIREIDNFTIAAGQTIYIVISTWADPQSTEYVLNITENTCIEPVYSTAIEGDCENNEFVATFTFSDLGSGATYTLLNDQNDDTVTVDEDNLTVSVGPFSNDTTPIVTIDAEDDNCDLSETLSYTCPPTNDICSESIDLVVGEDFDTNAVITNNVGATSDDFPAPGCANYQGGEVWFTVEVPASGNVKLETNGFDGSDIGDTGLAVYSGTCDDLVLIECDDDDSDDGLFSYIEISAATPGDILYVVAWEYSNNAFGQFYVSAYDDSTCTIPSYTYDITADCDAETFTVDFTVDTLGSTDTFDLSDDQGNTETITATGDYSYGPYATGTTLAFSIDTGNEECNSTFSIFYTCPPSNDLCEDATSLVVGNTFDSNSIVSTNSGATGNSLTPGCSNYQGGEVWFSFEVPESGHIIIETNSNEGSTILNTGLAVYSGTCNGLELIECDDNDSTDGNFSLIEFNDRTPGEILYVAVWEFGNDVYDNFQVSVYDDQTCVAPTYAYEYISDCEAGTYSIEFDFTDLGSLAELILSDDVNNTVTFTEAGVYTFGTYAIDQIVNFNLETGDVNCNADFTLSYSCPATNITCDDAISLVVGNDFETNPIVSNNINATGDALAPGCGSYLGGEVWFTVVVPDSGHIIIETNPYETSNMTDTGLAVYSGTCDGLELIECDDDDSDNGLFSLIELNNRTPGEILYVVVWEYGNDTFDTFQVSAYDDQTCIAPTYTFDFNGDCDAGTYTIDFDVTDLGSETEIILTDDVNNTTTITQAGVYTFGPYTDGQLVNFTLDVGDVNCNTDFQLTYSCPALNIDCDNAIEVTVGTEFNTNPIVAVNNGATGTNIATTCNGYEGGEVWFSVIVPENGNLTLETNGVEGSSLTDSVLTAYSGECDGLVQVGCDDDSSTDGTHSLLVLTGLNPGDLIYVAVYEYGNNIFGQFQFSAYSDDMAVNDMNSSNNKFTLYPNPVNGMAYFKGMDVSKVSIYSANGKFIKSQIVSNNQLNLDYLQTGTYVIEVTDIDGKKQTRKFIKK